MLDFLKIFGFAATAWLAHVLLVSMYASKFYDTGSLAFRALHMLEIAGIIFIVFWVYFRSFGSMSVGIVLLGIFVTLAILDGIGFVAIANAREMFDIWHFVAAYTSVALAVLAAYYTNV
jgi:hypothetical protein